MGHVVVENRNALVMGCRATRATGSAERDSALELLAAVPRNAEATVGADRAYDTRDFVFRAREQGLRPHVAQNTTGRRSAIDKRTTRFKGYVLSQRARPQRACFN